MCQKITPEQDPVCRLRPQNVTGNRMPTDLYSSKLTQLQSIWNCLKGMSSILYGAEQMYNCAESCIHRWLYFQTSRVAVAIYQVACSTPQLCNMYTP